MNKKGRSPSLKINDDILKTIEKMSGNGLTQLQISEYFGITPSTWYKYKTKNKNIKIAFNKGKSKTILAVTGKLMEQIRGGNLSAIIFYLKTQARWREKDSSERENKVKSTNVIYKIDSMDPIEASKIYQSIMTGSYNERNSTSK